MKNSSCIGSDWNEGFEHATKFWNEILQRFKEKLERFEKVWIYIKGWLWTCRSILTMNAGLPRPRIRQTSVVIFEICMKTEGVKLRPRRAFQIYKAFFNISALDSIKAEIKVRQCKVIKDRLLPNHTLTNMRRKSWLIILYAVGVF